ncbi:MULTISPECIES: Panacea domain-containing protein [unclassified Sphingomonas]|uniref:Panacea domain-containing protein n=1 Tax=unclassified Sphingomonas TaxID=196159 RepID=UPI0012E3E702|nr:MULTISPECIES: type II toxin-antitoxin system antitoxin SocA domain-containing protein [unclassified Sphingomonas]
MTFEYGNLNLSIRGLANWLLDYADSRGLLLTNMALNKLLFFAYEALLLHKGIVLTNAKIEAWEHGPVFREIYQAFKKFEDKPIRDRARFFSAKSGKEEVSSVSLSESDEATLRDSIEPLIRLSASRLREISHVEGGAWHQVWWYDGHANPGMEITPELIVAARPKG